VKKLRKYFFVLLCLFLSSCGRKNNTFLVFASKKKVVKINRLTLPAVRGLRIAQTKQGATLISWLPVEVSGDNIELVGYNLYKFVPTAFIPRKPVNKHPTTKLSYLDSNTVNYCYLVRAVFLARGKTVEGPASKILR